ncbi:hypothetical protein EYF80_053609 [Liparis tanakae]|uniref:Uncharacterized protein n=1 Tax=Liparis tanakae TaxID=230148 RepID=A0A4Z2F540_9TELE|nr:hypothetical protein EYF80_053609 [Liparis tanakae]
MEPVADTAMFSSTALRSNPAAIKQTVSFAPPSRRAEYASFGQRYPVSSEPPIKVSEENA